MAKDPAFLFYSQDFIVGVQTMDFEMRGKYITILAQMHQQGRMNEETIRFLVGNVSDNLKSKFSIDKNGMWYNKRLEEEIEKRKNFVDSRRLNGKKGGRPKANDKPNAKPLGKPKNNLTEDVNENEIISEIVNKENYNTELFEFINYLRKDIGKDVGYMQVEQMIKLLNSWYKSKEEKVNCLNKHIASKWSTLNFVEPRKTKKAINEGFQR